MEWNAKGQSIKIMEEKDFIPAVQCLIQHQDLSENTDSNWKNSVRAMLNEMVEEEELPENSLYLMENYGRDGKKITSYSVCIYEPDYPLAVDARRDPTRNSIIINSNFAHRF